jgi:hypothetical protein
MKNILLVKEWLANKHKAQFEVKARDAKGSITHVIRTRDKQMFVAHHHYQSGTPFFYIEEFHEDFKTLSYYLNPGVVSGKVEINDLEYSDEDAGPQIYFAPCPEICVEPDPYPPTIDDGPRTSIHYSD